MFSAAISFAVTAPAAIFSVVTASGASAFCVIALSTKSPTPFAVATRDIGFATNEEYSLFENLSQTAFDGNDSVFSEHIIAKQKMISTESVVMLTGWIPEFCQAKVCALLDKYDCAYDVAEPEENENPPILLKNNGFASNFEWVLGMYSYPAYGAT